MITNTAVVRVSLTLAVVSATALTTRPRAEDPSVKVLVDGLPSAGTPESCVVVSATALTTQSRAEVAWYHIEAHEQQLLRRAIDGLSQISGVTLYADSDDISDRVGVLTFNIDDVAAADVAEELAGTWAIAVRQGEFCAHPLCHRLMGVSDAEIIDQRDKPDFSAPAMVRVSMGMYNTEEDVDTLIKAVQTIAEG